MAQVQPVVRVELDPLKPVPEICAVIMAIIPYHKDHEAEILKGVVEALERRMVELKGVETNAK